MRTHVAGLYWSNCWTALAVIVGHGIPIAGAADVQWINSAGGLYFNPPPNPSNWSSGGLPGAADTAIFNRGSNYGVLFNIAPPNIRWLRVRNDSVVFALNGMTYNLSHDNAAGESLIVGQSAGQVGALTLAGPGKLTGGTSSIGGGQGSTGTFTVVNTAQAELDYLLVGNLGTGALQIGANSLVKSPGGGLGIWDTGIGKALITGAGAAWETSELIVGSHGGGELRVENGGRVETGGAILGYNTVDSNTLVTGANSKLTAEHLTVGYWDDAAATLEISSGGLVQTDSAVLGLFGKALVLVRGAGSKLDTGGGMSLNGFGSILRIDQGATGSASGLHIALNTGNDAALQIHGSGSTFTTQFESFIGYAGTGQVLVESGGQLVLDGVTRLGFNAPGTGRITVSGAGSMVSANNALLVGQNGIGEVIVQLGGRLDTNNIASIGGQAGYVRVDGTDSVWNAANVFIGSNSAIPSAIEIGAGGRFNVASTFEFTTYALLTLTGGLSNGGRMTIGSVVGPPPPLTLRIAADGTLKGGCLIGGHVVSDGQIELSLEFGKSPTLIAAANFQQTALGGLSIEIKDNTPGNFNSLQVQGTATLGGELLLMPTDDFVPFVGDTFDVVTFGDRVGRFYQIANLSSAGAGLSFAHVWTSNSLRLRVTKTGDANFDGFVDAADYTLWADHYLQTDNTWQFGDFNGDFIVDGADFTLWADNYAPSVFALAVPEPSAWILSLLGAAGAALAVGRRR